MSDLVFQVPLELRRGKLRAREQESVESGVELISLLSKSLGVDDLGKSCVLDIGCGCKFTQAFLDRKLPIEHYTGVDVYAEMIEFLQGSVTDARFDYHHMNTHNQMYNPSGDPLSAATQLPLGDRVFDAICLFSVFTHLAPHDYVAMLKMLRRYIKPNGKLFFSVFVNELTPGGFGRVDKFTKALKAADTASLSKYSEEFEKAADDSVPDFIDLVPEHPLKVAMYSRNHALELVENTGWKVESLNDPLEEIQHFMVCSPV